MVGFDVDFVDVSEECVDMVVFDIVEFGVYVVDVVGEWFDVVVGCFG